MNAAHSDQSIAKTWLWIAMLLSLILFKGLLAFSVVSDMGQPTWAYRPVRDLPAQSAYAAYQLLPFPQHIRGARGK
jgi:hypothetical protein